MSTLETIAAGFRADLLARDARAAAELTRAYASIWLRLRVDLDQLESAMATARAEGRTVGIGWLYRSDRVRQLLEQVEHQASVFAGQAEQTIGRQQTDATHAAATQAPALIEAAGATSFASFPGRAVQQMVGAFQPGSPLRSLLDQLGPDLSAGVRKALVIGIGTGQNPRQTARVMRNLAKGQAGLGLTRALTISRTEVLRAYRETTRSVFVSQSDVVPRWRWLSARSTRTCAACWAMDGQTFPVTEPMASHVNCRCVMVPLTRTAAPWQMGSEVFAKLDPKKQRTVLGQAKYDAYHDGRITLGDLVQVQESKEWGRSVTEGSLRRALAKGD